MEDDRRKKRKLARDEEKSRMLAQIDRGLIEANKEMKLLLTNYQKLLEGGADMDERLLSWQRFFNDVSLVSEEAS